MSAYIVDLNTSSGKDKSTATAVDCYIFAVWLLFCYVCYDNITWLKTLSNCVKYLLQSTKNTKGFIEYILKYLNNVTSVTTDVRRI